MIYLCITKRNNIIEEIFDSTRILLITENEKKEIHIERLETDNTNNNFLCKIKKQGNIYILENKNNIALINNTKIELCQIETGDIIQIKDWAIYVKIYPFIVENAYLEVLENPVEDKKIYKINRFLTFIGNPKKAHIPALSKNPFIPLSDYSAALIIRNERYELVPINTSVVRFRMKELKVSIPLESSTTFEVGLTKFRFNFNKEK